MDENIILTGILLTVIISGFILSGYIENNSLNQAANNTHFCMKSENDYSLDMWNISEFDCDRIINVCPHIPNLSPQMFLTSQMNVNKACQKYLENRDAIQEKGK
jgi:hypothetical protein